MTNDSSKAALAGQVGGAQQKPVAIVTVEHSGYSIRLSEHVAYALPEGRHELFPHPSLAPAAACVMPEPKKYTWDEIVGLVSEVLGCQYQKDPEFFIGHQMPGINFNSLSRIIDRVQHREVTRLNRNPIPMELLEKAAHWLEVHAPGAGSIEQDIADEIRAVTSKDDEVIVKDQLKPVAIVRSRYGDPEAFGERWLEVISDIQAMPYGAKIYAIPEGIIELLKRIAQMPSSPEAEMDRYEACDELRSLLAQQSHAAILTQRGQEARN
ncbi:hypothetical protein NNO07_22700 [Pseudomonas resinovorans]|uniref:Uncharacterized protein n=1 Tax=Metapseudomonas resinovorans TaxID=53412 RepID=A0ABT4YAI4_METRE|nr:hypothetical protein [Pseudomonas resinovorans]MDA8485887.1 hypothetical protein [Pseudomonas resinovorans]